MSPHTHRTLAALLCLLALASGARADSPAATPADTAAEAALREARQAGQDNRHLDAIAAYSRAEQAAPARRREWLLERADQHTWAQQLDAAIALYREVLAPPHAADADTARRARLGLARALSWAGRHAQAQAHYREVLARHPDDHDAQRGLARVLSWGGRHRQAVQQAQAFLRVRAHDREATLILAESLDWMGRADRAQAVLRAQATADPGDERAAALLRRLQQAQRPEFAADWREFDQSDDLAIDELSLGWRFSLQDGRGQLRPRYARARYRPPSGPVRQIEVQRPGLEARYRLDDALEWNGQLGLDIIETRGDLGPLNASEQRRRWTHDTTLTWWPVDTWRLDLSSARWTFDSEPTLRQGLTARQLKLAVDHRPDDLTRLSLATGRASYADGNRRRGLELQAERRVWQRPQLLLGLRHSRYDYTLPGQNGYYNPEQVQSTDLTAQAGGWLPAGVYWELRTALGRERERGSPTRPTRSHSLALAWHLQPGLSLEAAYDYSTSRTLATGGFARGIARVTVKLRPGS